MKTLFYISTAILILTSCCSPKADNCKGKILDLEMTSFKDPNNKLLNYYNTNTFIEVKDTNQFLRYEDSSRIPYLLKPSAIDPTKWRYTIKVKEAIIKTANYQWDLIVMIDNDKKAENVGYWLKSYDNNRREISHLDLAIWSADKEWFSSGRIDCDTTFHMILHDRDEHRIFKVDQNGKLGLLKTVKLSDPESK